MLIKRTWTIPKRPDPNLVSDLAEKLSLPPLLAQCLIHRGMADFAEAERYLKPELLHLHDPELFGPVMEIACERIKKAIDNKEHILVHGDFDADGVTATALLLDFFKLIGIEATHYIPDRIHEGFSFGPKALEIVEREKIPLCVTVDNGISAVHEVEKLNSLGCNVIITDHHEPGPSLPDALAILDPKLPDSPYPFRSLAGVGVAFKLVWAIARNLSGSRLVSPPFREFLVSSLNLVALGTIADVVPLIDENRILARFGLKNLSKKAQPGLEALKNLCRLSDKELTARDVAFRLAPRINAAGRIDKADMALELLLAKDADKGHSLALKLDKANKQRQNIEKVILSQARRKLSEDPTLSQGPVIVLADRDWHPGVIGIVASRLCDQTGKPAILIAIQGETGRGSARSPKGFPIHTALEAADDLLISHGGHDAAAGLKVETNNIDALRQRLCEIGDSLQCPPPPLTVDAFVEELEHITPELIQVMARMRPFGTANLPPLFAGNDLTVAGNSWASGWEGRDLSFLVRKNGTSYRAVVPNGAAQLGGKVLRGMRLNMAFTPRLSWKNGEVELAVQAMQEKNLDDRK